MPRKFTTDDVKKRVLECTNGRVSAISDYTGRYDPMEFHCDKHNINFVGKYDWYARKNSIRGDCPLCVAEKTRLKYTDRYTTAVCAYCGKIFKCLITRSKTKSGMKFCCREHKDAAQRLCSGEDFIEMRPPQYSNGQITINTYRQSAFAEYPHRCAVCGYSEDPDLLEVHHIDGDRKNNDIGNLIILCPTCHRKLTLHKYILKSRNALEKIK